MSECTSSSEQIHEVAAVNNPPANAIAGVLAMPPPPTMGTLCLCNGSAVPPQQYLSSAGVRVLCRRPTEPAPTDAEMFSLVSPVFPVGTQYLWQKDNAVPAFCEANPANNNNILYVRAAWINMMMPGPPIVEATTLGFKGKRVQNCAEIGGVVAPIPTTASTELAAAPLPMFVDREPWDISGGYIEYRHLSAEQFFWGNRLLRRGEPLRARRIAVAAFDVAWQYDSLVNPPALITRSIGELTTAPAGWQFMGLPQASIVIWQLGEPRRVVISECRDKPDIIALDPDAPIYVQVNFPWLSIAQRSGSFGLHVRVID